MKDVPNWSFKLLFKSVALPQVICKKKKIELASEEHTHGYLEEGSHSWQGYSSLQLQNVQNRALGVDFEKWTELENKLAMHTQPSHHSKI